MKEEEGARYLSPLVKQDLAKLDTDGDTRRLAVQSLKLFVEQLDASTLPRFISQIAESREPGATRSYAISMYEEVARVHGKLVVPHIPKVMAALVRSSSASGSFPILQQACARVTAALARHGIDSATSKEEAEEIMREICTPLIDALSGKLEPVAATAASCIHALAETEKWKFAREEIVHDVCQRTTVALSEKSTRTAAHMQLIRILASLNPDTLCLHGASLLRAGEEILKVTANPWQLRKAAAQLLQSVLTILDKEALQTELNPALHALDSCRLDRMPHVRAAVSEALHTAKMLASGNSATHTSSGMAASPIRKSPGSDRSPRLHEDHAPVSPMSKRGPSLRAASMSPRAARTTFSPRAVSRSPRAASPTSQESRRLLFSSASTSTSESVQAPRSPATSVNKGSGLRARRAPLYPARGMGYNSVHSPRSSGTPGTSPSGSTTTVEECESPSRRLTLKELNVQSRSKVANGLVYPGEDEAGHGDNFLRPRAPLTTSDTLDVEVLKLNESGNVPLLELTRDSTIEESAKIVPLGQDSGLANFVSGFENARQGRANSSSTAQVEVALPRLKLGGVNSFGLHSPLEHSGGSDTPVLLKASSICLQTGDSGSLEDVSPHDNESSTAYAEVEKRQIFSASRRPIIRAAGEPELGTAWKLKSSGDESAHGSSLPSSLKHSYKPLAHLDVNLEFEEKTDPTQCVSIAKDGFLPLMTPKRLVRSLSSLSLPECRGSFMLDGQSDRKLEFSPSDAADTASETGWSVRDNPIASEESYRAESSDEELDAERRCSLSAFENCSPREIRMVSPAPSSKPLVRPMDHSDHASVSEDTDDHSCPSCASMAVEQSFTSSCRLRTPGKDMDVDTSPCGLSSLLHKDELNLERPNLSPDACGEANSGPDTPPSASSKNRRSERGLMTKVAHNWKKLCCYTETALGGSLCFVIALPLAMVLVKALNSSRGECHHLVPT